MKFLKLFIFPLVFAGCQSLSANVKSITDNRPATELSFVKKLKIADSLYNSDQNDIKKDEAVKNGKAEISKFITDTLHLNVSQWHAFVYEVTNEEPYGYAEITLLISRKVALDPDEKYPKLSNIVLKAQVQSSDSTLTNSIKNLYKGDEVLVSGSFEKNVVGNIDFDPLTPDKDDTFNNPAFIFNIKNVVKSVKK